MFVDEPYFMKNKNWYYFDFEKRKYKLTTEAPKEAVKSYNDYYKAINSIKK